MRSMPAMPTQAEFLAAPKEAVFDVAPSSIVYAPGGTRRSAAFAGIEPGSAEYLRVLYDQFSACLANIFRYGVKHVFTPMVMTGHADEVEDIERDLIRPFGRFVTDPHLIAICRKHGWRLRIVPSAYGELLQPAVNFLEENTPRDAVHTWWMTCTPSHESWWSNLFSLIKSEQISTRSEAIRSLYGEDIPPIMLCISFGKFMMSPDLLPPLLMDNVQCYWSQQVGYSLSDRQFRKILYDFAYLRQTWQKNKSARAKEARIDQEIWEQEMILGLGKRLGSFWYPALPTSPVV